MSAAAPAAGGAQATVVLGAQWGDEGTGKLVDWLCHHARTTTSGGAGQPDGAAARGVDVVCRFAVRRLFL